MSGKKWLKRLTTLVFAFSVLSVPFLGGCAKHPSPSPEEMTRLEEASRGADAAEKALEQKKEEKTALEAQLSAKKAELQKLEARRDAIKANAAKK